MGSNHINAEMLFLDQSHNSSKITVINAEMLFPDQIHNSSKISNITSFDMQEVTGHLLRGLLWDVLNVLLFYLFVLPVIGLIIVIMWRVYLNVCEHCEKNLTRRHSVVYSVVDIQDLRLRHECCKKNVAPILVNVNSTGES